ncbi:MAG: hypothetical protein ABFD89_09055 [Bryobacteraceae bacterium]
MPSEFQSLIEAALWPAMLPLFGETISHDPNGVTAAYSATLVFDDGAIIQQKPGTAAVISGPVASFTTVPVKRDVFTRADGSDYVCFDVEDDLIGGYRCWCRLKSAT